MRCGDTLVGLLFLNPLAGLLIGAAAGAGAGALSGALADYGIDDDFIKSLGEQIGPDTSALFVLLRKVTIDKVLPELAKYEGRVMKTSLSNEQEQKLRDAISHQRYCRPGRHHDHRLTKRAGGRPFPGTAAGVVGVVPA